MKGIAVAIIFFVASLVCAFAQQQGTAGYKIQINDVLRIQVYGEQQINVEVPVDQEGNISAPFVGTFVAAGKTTSDLEEELTKAYQERLRLKKPKVSVTFSVFHPQRATVSGAVQRPGQFEFRPGDTILTLLANAGGPIPSGVSEISADYRRAKLKRKNSDELIPIDLNAMLIRGDLSQNYVLEDGDSLDVPIQTRNKIQVLGMIQRPGTYPYREAMTLSDVISQAGGEIPRQSMFSRITITRQIPGTEGQYYRIQANFVDFLAKGNVSQNVVLQPGDFVYIPSTKTPNISELSGLVNSAFYIDQLLRQGIFGFRVFR